MEATASEAGDDRLALCDVLCIFYQHSGVVVHQSVTAAEHGKGREGGHVPRKTGLAIAKGPQIIALCADNAHMEGGEKFARGPLAITAGADQARLERGETLAGNAGAGDDVLAQEPGGEMMKLLGETALAAAPLRFHADGEVVHTLLPAVDLIALANEDGVDTNAGKGVGRMHQAIAGSTVNTLVERVNAISDIVQGGGDELGGHGGRWSAEVGDEVCNSEIGFVANGGNDGKLGFENGFGEELGVEGGEVFERTTAAGNDDDVDGAGAVEVGDAGGDFGGSGLTLNECRVERNVQAGVPAIDDVDEVADDGASRRCDDADTAREGGQGFLVRGIEETAGVKTLAELLEGDLQRACTDRLEEFGNELHLAALLVDGNFAAEQDVKAIRGTKAQQRCLLAEEDGGELGVTVLQREVDVAGGRGAEVGDFTFDPEVTVLTLDVNANFADKVADRPNAT